MSANTTQLPVDLDPHDWEQFRAVAHIVIDDMVDYLRDVRTRPVWQSPSNESRAFLSSTVPRTGRDVEAVYRDVRRHILPYATGNVHPRFWGWVMGNGTAVGVLADLVASAMNCHVSGYDQAATLVERQVIGWLCAIMGFPQDASGLLVSGGTVANLIGLTVARNTATEQRVRREGVLAEPRAMTVYGSEATHGWIWRSCDLLGLGERAFRSISVDARHRVRIDEMARRIAEDRERGCMPFCIVGNAGTVATGATDDLRVLAELARAEELWLHIDGAFGAMAKLSPKYAHVVDGLEQADSLAFDLHKWGYMQYEIGVTLVRDAEAHGASFSFAPSYLETFRGGIGVEPTEFAGKGPQLSRGFRALKVWMNLSSYGTDRIGEVIEQNIEQAQALRARIISEPELELLGPAELNVVCFRFVADAWSNSELDLVNAELLVRLQIAGTAVPSNARIGGHFALRIAHTNHRTRPDDFDVTVKAILDIGRDLVALNFGRASP